MHHFINARNQQQNARMQQHLSDQLSALERRLQEQDLKQVEQKEWQTALFNESLGLEKNIELLTNGTDLPELEQNGKKIASYYLKHHQSLSEVFNPDNYSALEYKELALKCVDRLLHLQNLRYYEWGRKQVVQEGEARALKRQEEAQARARAEAEALAEEKANRKPILDRALDFIWNNKFISLIIIFLIGVVMAVTALIIIYFLLK